ncbi:hypothetical protein F4X10_06645 [Candidatus Poribacteria bacterium]|nr:hypothetical protein [Candidatus Poribacteria bacterium]MYC75432.1 hypothetical protein [Candidatus Poribacteria bacterium]
MAAEKKRAEKTSFILGYMKDGNPITDIDDMVKFPSGLPDSDKAGKITRFASTSFSHDEDSEKQQSDSIRGSDADVFGEDGFLWGSGGFEMEVPLLGSLHILRALLRDAKPVSRNIPDKTIVAAGTKVSEIVKDKYFTHTRVTVVDDQGLTGGTPTIANALSAYSQHLDKIELTVAPASGADLDNSSTPATIKITYTDTEKQDTDITLTFANSVKGDPQQTEIPAGATIKSVATTGWKAGGKFTVTAEIRGNADRNPDADRPGRLRFKFSAAAAGDQITVRGVRRVGLASDDTLPMKEVKTLTAAEATAKDATLIKYFHKIEKIEVNGTEVSGATVEVISTPGGYETTLKMSNDLIELMMEAEVGGIPRKITRGEFTTGQLNISDTVRLVIDMLSKRVDKRSTIEGGDAEKFVATAAERPSEFAFVSEKFFPDWGGYMELDSEAFVFDSATVDINRNEDFSAGKRASRFRAGLESGTRRNVTAQVQGSYISGTSEEDKFIRWDEKFRNNEAVAVKIANYHWPTTGRQYSMEWIMEYCEVTSPVRVEATSPGNIPITVDLKAVPNPTDAGASELTVKIVSDDRWV